MLEVLVADDEAPIRDWLKYCIESEADKFHVAAVAANGKEAYELIRQLKPDVVITDIRMPGMDGLELIQELRSRGADSHVIILSGYADFEYAKRAITYRIDGYLLKPVDEEELISYLDQLRDTLAKEHQFSQWQEAEPIRNREAILKELLQPEAVKGDVAQMHSYAESLGIPEGPCEVVLLKLKRMNTITEDRLSGIRQTLEQMIERKNLGMVFNYSSYIGILLIRPLQEAERELYQDLAEIIHREHLEFSAAAGGAVSGIEEAYLSLSAASDALNMSFFCSKDTFIRDISVEACVDIGEDVQEMLDYAEAENRLLLVLETGNPSKLEPLVAKICRRMALDGMDELKLKENLIRMVGSILARLESSHPDLRPFLTEHAAPVGAFYQSGHIRDLMEETVSFLQQVSEQINRGSKGNDIQKMIDLIHRRFHENLKLEILSDLFNYNSAYLGKMFKNTTGEYFNTYLDKVRIEKAKEYLEQGMKVYEVAEKIGYMNPDYFNMKFRKYVGESPTSYRKGK